MYIYVHVMSAMFAWPEIEVVIFGDLVTCFA